MEDPCKMIDSEHDESPSRDLAVDYELLCSQNKEQAEKLEALNQEVHSLRNRLQVAERVQAECQSELDSHQDRIVEANASQALMVLKLKEDHYKIVQELESKVNSLENDLQEMRQKHAHEKDEFLKAKKELRDMQDSSPVASLKAELQDIMEEHAANRMACVQHQELNKILLKEKSELLEELKNTKEHLLMIEEKLKIREADLMEQSEALEDLRESHAVIQSELACLKAGPSEAVSRGNSLFAEVEDKRQSMLKKCSSLAKKYNEMKKDYSAKCAEISKLKLENLKLRRQWQEEAEERDNRDVWLNDNYEIRIKELLKMVEDLKREEKAVFVNGDSKILTYAEQVVEQSKKDMTELREEMERRSSERLNEAKALYIARSEVQTLKAQLMSVHAENLVLRDKLGEANITDIPSPGKTLQRLKDMWQKIDENSAASIASLPSSVNHCCEVPSSSSSDQISELETDVTSCSPAEETSLSQTEMLASINSEDFVMTGTINSGESAHDQALALVKPSVISTLVSNIPKPSRLLRMEMMEKLQSENEVSKTISEEGKQAESSDVSPTTTISDSLHDPVVKQYNTSLVLAEDENTSGLLLPSSITTEELASPELSPSSETMSGEIKESPKFIAPYCIKPISNMKAEKKNELSLEDEFRNIQNTEALEESENTFQDCSISVAKTSCRKSDEITSEVQKNVAPRRSILAKVSRPSLVPLDQNSLSRKVRFADSDMSVASPEENQCQGTEVLPSQSPKKKLVRMPPPKTYKTRIVVSRETAYQ